MSFEVGNGAALLELEGVTKHFKVRRGAFGGALATVKAIEDVSFEIRRG